MFHKPLCTCTILLWLRILIYLYPLFTTELGKGFHKPWENRANTNLSLASYNMSICVYIFASKLIFFMDLFFRGYAISYYKYMYIVKISYCIYLYFEFYYKVKVLTAFTSSFSSNIVTIHTCHWPKMLIN